MVDIIDVHTRSRVMSGIRAKNTKPEWLLRVFKWPKTREAFWREKISGNQADDRKAVAKLAAVGWRVAVLWECALSKRPEEMAMLVCCIGNWLRGAETYFEQ